MENNSTQQQNINPQAGQPTQISEPITPQVKVVKNRKPLMVVVIVILWAGSLAGAYFAKDLVSGDDNKTTETASKESTQTTATSSTKDTIAKTTFDYKKAGIPITFDYPSDWSLTTGTAFFSSEEMKDVYEFKLITPGTAESETMIGGLKIMKGATITFNIGKVSDATLYPPKMGLVGEAKSIKVAGIEALQYAFAYESEPFIGTKFIKDGMQYDISFSSDKSDEKTSDYYDDYINLINSIEL